MRERDWKRFVRERLGGVGGAREAEIVEELAQQVESAYEEALAAGSTEVEALERAERQLGDWSELAREIRSAVKHAPPRMPANPDNWRKRRRPAVLADAWHDARYAGRMLRGSPLFTLVVVLTLALGIGANTAVFSLVRAALLRPLPYRDPARLVHLWDTRGTGVYEKFEASYPDFADWRQQTSSFAELGGYTGAGFTVLGGEVPERISASRATWNFFAVLGVRPALGRDFRPEDEPAGAPGVTLLSHGYWVRRFGGDPNVIGRSINFEGTLFTVIGVLPAEFHFAPRGGTLAWTPLRMDQDRATRRSSHWLNVIGRLKADVSPATAATEMKGIAARLAEQYPESNAGVSVSVVPLREEISGRIQPILVVMMSAVGLVLLIGCANVANLMLARAAAREKEFAIRAALGAGRARLVRQLLVEGLLLSLGAGAAGLLLAAWAIPGLLALVPRLMLDGMPYLKEAAVDRHLLGFTLAASVFTGIFFSFAPALHALRRSLSGPLKEGGRVSGASGGEWLRRLLVVVEVALALVLLVGAALMLQSLNRLLAVELGFRRENLLTMVLRLPESKYPIEQVVQFAARVRERMAVLPGVESASTASSLPASTDAGTLLFDVRGKVFPADQVPEASFRIVSPNYFRALGIPLLAGRELETRDTPAAAPVVLVNRTLARSVFGEEDPIGRVLRFRADGSIATIAGVVGDVKLGDLDAAMRPTIYASDTQVPSRSIRVVLRAAADPKDLIAAARREVTALDPELPVFLVQTMDEVIAESSSVFARRFVSSVMAGFAALALVLASIGLYGVMSYLVAQRVHEIGVRLALGAQMCDIFRLVVGQGMGMAALGIMLGCAGALGTARLLDRLLYQVKSTDAATYGAVAILLAAIALAACALPARRAARIDPLAALREE
jgi:predicted permease